MRMKQLQEILQTKGKFKQNMLILSGICLIYAIFYQIFAQVLYQQENTLLLYLYSYVLSLLAGGIVSLMIQKILKDQQGTRVSGKAWVVSFVCLQTIYFVVLGVLGYASFYMALTVSTGILAYVINAVLVLVVLFYVPVLIFGFYHRSEKCNPFVVILKSIQTIVHQYQPVFYSCLLAAIVFVGYRYLMQSVFSFQMGVALYDLPMEIMTRWVPFLDVAGWIPLLSENGALLHPLCFSILFSFLQCGVLLALIYYLGAVDRKENTQ